jgi:hypothetical protein
VAHGAPRPKLSLDDLPKRMGWGNYQVEVSWRFLEEQLADWKHDLGLDLDPDFQRGHVWTETQQRAYVEFCLTGGKNANFILFNARGWNGRSTEGMGPLELVDGKQRLTAILRFLHDDLSVFDDVPGLGPVFRRDLDRLDSVDLRLSVFINGLNTRAEVLRWYLELNSGGTPHTQEELDKVRGMAANEPD